MQARNPLHLPGKYLGLPVLLVLVSGAFLWLFLYPVQKGDGLTPRLFSAFWNLGHYGLFFIWGWLLSTAVSRWLGIQGWKLMSCCLLLSLLAGYAIEEAQFNDGERSASIDDLMLDVIGAFVALAFHPKCRLGMVKSVQRSLILVAVVLSAYAFYPVSLLLTDTFWQWRQFPVLLDFSTPLELSRIKGSADYVIAERAGSDTSALRVTFTEQRHSVFGFSDFPSDWRGYKQLQIFVFNPEAETIDITCRIQDQTHNRRHDDLYRESFTIVSGANNISIDLEKARQSPRGRKLDMSSIDLTFCYTVNLTRKRILWIDKIVLVE